MGLFETGKLSDDFERQLFLRQKAIIQQKQTSVKTRPTFLYDGQTYPELMDAYERILASVSMSTRRALAKVTWVSASS